ncbi:MAG: hypothetical protein KDA75_17380 [Planctomycetaceae bacterium]|nr:hypothetical protein [Planctomycetaceae bacterium]
MSLEKSRLLLKLICGLGLLAVPAVCHAGDVSLPTGVLGYIGPGAGLGALGALVALVVAVLIGLAGIVLYPLQLLRQRIAGKGTPKEEGSIDSPPKA